MGRPALVGQLADVAYWATAADEKTAARLFRHAAVPEVLPELALPPYTHVVSCRVTLRAWLSDAKSSLGDAKSSLGDAESSLGDAESSLVDIYRTCTTRAASGRRRLKVSARRLSRVGKNWQ